MDEEVLQRVVRELGLELALRLFPEDVAVAAAQVEAQRRALQNNFLPSDEPWPPMRVPGS